MSVLAGRSAEEARRRVRAWAREILGELATISVGELQCREPGCPPIETVIARLSEPKAKWKIHKTMAELTLDEIATLLSVSQDAH